MSTELTVSQKASALKSLKKFHADPPFNGFSNSVAGDGYYKNSLIREFGMSISELGEACGYAKWKIVERKAYARYLKEIGD